GCFFLPDGESLVTIDQAGRVVLHGLPDLQERQEVVTRRAVQCADLAPDGQGLALGCADGRVCFLAIDGLEAATLLVTPTETTRPAPGRWRRLFRGRRDSRAYACTCPSCQHPFEMPDGSLGQPASCPSCRRSLRLNRVARPA